MPWRTLGTVNQMLLQQGLWQEELLPESNTNSSFQRFSDLDSFKPTQSM